MIVLKRYDFPFCVAWQSDGQEVASVVSAQEIRVVAELLQISPEGLQKAITYKVTVSIKVGDPCLNSIAGLAWKIACSRVKSVLFLNLGVISPLESCSSMHCRPTLLNHETQPWTFTSQCTHIPVLRLHEWGGLQQETWKKIMLYWPLIRSSKEEEDTISGYY